MIVFFFVFKLNTDGSLMLLESDLANKFSAFIDYYLKVMHSIPDFLAACTFELSKLIR